MLTTCTIFIISKLSNRSYTFPFRGQGHFTVSLIVMSLLLSTLQVMSITASDCVLSFCRVRTGTGLLEFMLYTYTSPETKHNTKVRVQELRGVSLPRGVSDQQSVGSSPDCGTCVLEQDPSP